MSRLWHSALAILIVFALVGQIGLVFSGEGRSLINLFSYFTIQSNILILVASVLLVLKPDREGELFAIFRLAGLVGITLTGIVYSTVLAGTAEFVGAAWWYDMVFHYAVPVGAVLGFLLFQPRTRFARSDVVFVLWPIYWLAYTLIRAGISTPRFPMPHRSTSYVPYDFLDIQKHGPLSVIVLSALVSALMLGIAAAYMRFSKRDITVSARRSAG